MLTIWATAETRLFTWETVMTKSIWGGGWWGNGGM
jgi:hypothetical protein